MIPSRLVYFMFSIPRMQKRTVMIAVDAVAALIAMWFSFVLRLGEVSPELMPIWLLVSAPVATAIALTVFKFYRAIVRYQGEEMILSALGAVGCASAGLVAMTYMLRDVDTPRSVFIIFVLLMMVYLAASRLFIRQLYYQVAGRAEGKEQIAIFGAGEAGARLVMAFKTKPDYFPVMIVDDAKGKQNSLLAGVPVVSRDALVKAIEGEVISTVLLAIPSLARPEKMKLVEWLEEFHVHVMTVPDVSEIVEGKAKIDDIKEIAIEDLLGRSVVSPKGDLLELSITNKTVLVTGAGGSIGSELCRQIVMLKPTKIVLYELSEFALYSIEKELSTIMVKLDLNIKIISVLGSVVDKCLLLKTFKEHHVQTIYHAAAYKHVPIIEANPIAGLNNNIVGTYHAAMAAEEAEIERFILVSTDKAVRPTNIMGATKRFAEMILQAKHECGSKTIFSMVRFGNVLGSSGSVVPLFREQISNGGPVTVTHPDIIRYFMTIPEAAQLVIQAGSMAKGGDVFVLDMGEPVKIVDLAESMIHLMGMSVKNAENLDGDIEITFTGLRPGEKLYEELLVGDSCQKTSHPMIMKEEENYITWEDTLAVLDGFKKKAAVYDAVGFRSELTEVISGFR